MGDQIELSHGGKFTITLDGLLKVKSKQELTEVGGVEGLAQKLNSNLENGLSEAEIAEDFAARRSAFGSNVLTEPPTRSLLSLAWEAFQDPMLILLFVAAIVSIVIETVFAEPEDKSIAWIEGTAILVAVVLVVSVTSGNNYSKEKKFRALNKVKNDRQVKVLRAGKEDKVSILTIQAGDIIILDTGDQVPADGVFIEGHNLGIDESNMTGESDTVKKNHEKPFLLSGCQVAEGSGRMIVTAVGINSEWGQVYSKLADEGGDTPLQEMLEQLAKMIGYLGMAVAILLFMGLTIKWGVEVADKGYKDNKLKDFIEFVILCITIVVVAVPEGLPLAVTITLAYSMKAMLKDNNLVRHLEACETMGGCTNICSDKTGTLTENRMTVTSVWIAGRKLVEGKLEETVPQAVKADVVDLLCTSMCTNSSAFLKYPANKAERIEFIGSKTECALLVLSDKLQHDYSKVRKANKIITLFPFSSDRKRMSTVIEGTKRPVLHSKGASEIILALCSSYVDPEGAVRPLKDDDVEELKNTITEFASQGLRTLSIAYKNLDDENNLTEAVENELTLIALVGIQDPVRVEVPPAIQRCKDAGITVRMVTGDNKLTATKIAQECGILVEGAQVMEGPTFRALSDDEVDAILPTLRVLARSSPSDKHRLVTRLKLKREVVAVTGDGTNDGPALKAADVGLAMGIAGTEIAKEASDIIIMDDNFASIVKSVMWGRVVRENIQKFLQFQLTVNVVALVVTFVGALSNTPALTAIQLLWVNLIQDTLAALALATEKPTESLLDRKPAGRFERLITPTMWRNIMLNAAYQIIVLFIILFAGEQIFGDEILKTKADCEDICSDIKHMYREAGYRNVTLCGGNDESRYPDEWPTPYPAGFDPMTTPVDCRQMKDPTVLSTLLFNTFVLMQLFNEINVRRLDNYWNCFDRFFSNYIFLGIVFLTVALQVLFVEVGGRALDVVRLDWQPWLISLAFGFGMLLWGTLVRTFVPPPNWDWLRYQKGGAANAAARDAQLEEVELP